MKTSKSFSLKQLVAFVQCNKSTLVFIIFFIIFLALLVYYGIKSSMDAHTIELTVVVSMVVSFVFFVLMKFLVAEIKFGEEIRRLKNENNRFEYMIANRSAFFKFNVENVYFKIITIYETDGKFNEDILFFSANQKYILNKQKFPDKQDKRGNEEFFRFSISYENLKGYLEDRKSIYGHIIDKYTNGDNNIDLEDVLVNPKSTFTIIVDGYSSFTGERRTYISDSYQKKHIKEGKGWNNWKVRQ